MLPSKGYFSTEKCFFFNRGMCDRPYCHFRHSRKVAPGESDSEVVINAARLVADNCGGLLDAVKLAEDVMNNFKEDFAPKDVGDTPTYHPTPLSQLNTFNEPSSSQKVNRHIPIQYLPTCPPKRLSVRDSNTILPLKKYTWGNYDPVKAVSETASEEKEVKTGSFYSSVTKSPGSDTDSNKDKYTSVTYNPTKTESEYIPVDALKSNNVSTYVPSSLSANNSNSDKYVPSHSGDDVNSYAVPEIKTDLPTYHPNPVDATSKNILEYTPTTKNSSDSALLLEYSPSVKLPEASELKDEKSKSQNENDDKSGHSSSKSPSSAKPDKHDKSSHKSSRHRSRHDSKSRSKHHKSSKSDSKSRRHSSDKHERKDKNGKSEHKSRKRHHSDSRAEKSHRDDDKHRSKHKSKHRKIDSPDKTTKVDKTETKKDEAITNSFEGITDLDFSIDWSEDDDDIEEQCRRLFEEDQSTRQSKKLEPSEPSNNTPDESIKNEADCEETSKKRIAHNANASPILKRLPRPERYRDPQIRALMQLSLINSQKSDDTKSTSKSIGIAPPKTTAGKIRIAHVPNVEKLISAKNTVLTATQNSTPVQKTIAQTSTKGKLRVAHVPNDQEKLQRPLVLNCERSKFAIHIRLALYYKLIDTCLTMYADPNEAYKRAQEEELRVYTKCTSIAVYRKSMCLTNHRLQTEANKQADEGSSQPSASLDSQFNVDLYEHIKKYVLPEEELILNGFPRPDPLSSVPGAAIIYNTESEDSPKDPHERVCCRCHKVIRINKQGFPIGDTECVYHPSRKYRFRGEAKYGCCGISDDSVGGCQTAATHVYNSNLKDLRGFVQTMDRNENDSSSSKFGIFSLDCEMSYTTDGLELTRVTVINTKLETVYDTLVKPFHPILDYNTRFSGITAEKLENVQTSLLNVQATLLHLFNSETILVGHSLESDLKALKLIHNKVIDTSVLYPHRLGPPFKRALKTLASEFLSKIIQNEVSGHDSTEDAKTCMELILLKYRMDPKHH